jgi:hypothetical protein
MGSLTLYFTEVYLVYSVFLHRLSDSVSVVVWL